MAGHDDVWDQTIAKAFHRLVQGKPDGLATKRQCLDGLQHDDELCALLGIPCRPHMGGGSVVSGGGAPAPSTSHRQEHTVLYRSHFEHGLAPDATRSLDLDEFNEFCTRVHLHRGGEVGSGNARVQQSRHLQGWHYPKKTMAPPSGEHFAIARNYSSLGPKWRDPKLRDWGKVRGGRRPSGGAGGPGSSPNPNPNPNPERVGPNLLGRRGSITVYSECVSDHLMFDEVAGGRRNLRNYSRHPRIGAPRPHCPSGRCSRKGRRLETA